MFVAMPPKQSNNSSPFSSSSSVSCGRPLKERWIKTQPDTNPKTAFSDLNIPFVEGNEAIVVDQPFGTDYVSELAHVSNQYHHGTKEHHSAAQNKMKDILSDEEAKESGGSFQLLSDSCQDVHTTCNSKRDIMRPWISQVFKTGYFHLGDISKYAKYSKPTGRDPSNPWFNLSRFFLTSRGVHAQMFNINKGGYYQDHAGPSKLTLQYADRLWTDKRELAPVKVRWLHLQDAPSNYEALRYLVSECPYVSNPLRTVALDVLQEAEGQTIQSHGQKSQINTGTVIHKFGRMHKGRSAPKGDTFEYTEPVIFLSTPYLAVSEAQVANSHSEEDKHRSLLEFIYGRDVEDLQQTHIHPLIDGTARANDYPSIEVPEAEFLLIGSDMLISTFKAPLQNALSPTICIKPTEPESQFYTVKIATSPPAPLCLLPIRQDYSLESFLRDAFKLAGWEAPLTDHCKLTIDDGRIVDTRVWCYLLATGEVEKHIFTPNEIQMDPGIHDIPECIKYSRRQVSSSAYNPAAYQYDSAHLSRPCESLSDSPKLASITPVAVYFPEGLTTRGTSCDANSSQQNSNAFSKFWAGLRSYPHYREYIKDLDDLRSVLRLENVVGSTAKREVTLSVPSNNDSELEQATLVQDHEQWKTQLVYHRHESLLKKPFGKYYRETRPCEKQVVADRCRVLIPIPASQQRALLNSAAEEETVIPDACGRYKLNRPCEFILIEELFSLSEELFSFFLPGISDEQHTEQVYEHLWGSLDEIIRVHVGSIVGQHNGKKMHLRISPLLSVIQNDSLYGNGNALPPNTCDECQDATSYESIFDAISHVHDCHFRCSQTLHPTNLLDDPCMGWIYRVSSYQVRRDRIITPAATFVGDLLKIRDSIQQLQLLVQDEDAGYPTSLVSTFEWIVGKYVLLAKQLSCLNRIEDGVSDAAASASNELTSLCTDALEIDRKLSESLRTAKSDIMISEYSKGEAKRIVTSTVSAELLLASLVRNLQRDTFDQVKKGRLDIVGYYRRLSSVLRASAIRRPKRRMFLEISAHEEELDALRAVFEIQGRTLKAYTKVLDPDRYEERSTDESYLQHLRDTFPLVKKQLDEDRINIERDAQSLSVLHGHAQITRHDLKQVLEVLDEGHGKAIRALTFVTVFFLPLSFVTSFLGMNVSDVRDINRDRKVFWFSAIPLTFAVVSFSIIYGYKWEALREWLQELFGTPHSILARTIVTEEEDLEPSR